MLGVLAAGAAAVPLTGMAEAAVTAGPTITVAGYAVVNKPQSVRSAGQFQLQFTVQETATTATQALTDTYKAAAEVKKKLESAGIKAGLISNQQGYPFLNITGGEYQGSTGFTVTFPTLARLATILTKTGLVQDPSVQGFFVNGPSEPAPGPATSAIAQGYGAALANARATADAIAREDHVTLGQMLTVTEGSNNSSVCTPAGCSPAIGVVPSVGQNQVLEAVTVSFASHS